MQSSGVLILAVGLIVIYLAITGRYKCFTNLLACIGGSNCECSDSESSSTAKVITPLTPLQPIFPQ